MPPRGLVAPQRPEPQGAHPPARRRLQTLPFLPSVSVNPSPAGRRSGWRGDVGAGGALCSAGGYAERPAGGAAGRSRQGTRSTVWPAACGTER